MAQAPKVRIDLYELPHLFGFWLEDPEIVIRKEKALGVKYWPKAILFFGQDVHRKVQARARAVAAGSPSN